MNAACRSFRALLEMKLTGRAAQSELAVLSWHEHLLACDGCRTLLQTEEALELLLASLPEPQLPPELAARVVSRLRAARVHDAADAGLDALLELDPTDAPPTRLAESVLSRLRPMRDAVARGPREVSTNASKARDATRGAEASRAGVDARLDALLESNRAVTVPEGLAARILAGLRSTRAADARRAASRFALSMRTRVLLAAAAIVLVSWVGWRLWGRSTNSAALRENDVVQGSRAPHTASDPSLPDPQMLAALDVLEQWDLLMHEDVDVLLSTLDPAELDTIDETQEEPAPPPPAVEVEEPRSKG